MTTKKTAPTTTTTRLQIQVQAPRAAVYRALVDERALAKWKVPDGMTMHVHEFAAYEGGNFRISLKYQDESREGKSEEHTDTYRGHFRKLVPNEKVVEEMEFETKDPAMRGKMTSTIELFDKNGGTEVSAVHQGLPKGVKPEDNELGWKMSLAKLKSLVESKS